MVPKIIGDGSKSFKVGFTLPRKNAKRRHYATIRADDVEGAIKQFEELVYNAEAAGRYILCTGDWSVITYQDYL